MKFSKIIGTGGYLPEKVVTNADLEKILDMLIKEQGYVAGGEQ